MEENTIKSYNCKKNEDVAPSIVKTTNYSLHYLVGDRCNKIRNQVRRKIFRLQSDRIKFVIQPNDSAEFEEYVFMRTKDEIENLRNIGKCNFNVKKVIDKAIWEEILKSM